MWSSFVNLAVNGTMEHELLAVGSTSVSILTPLDRMQPRAWIQYQDFILFHVILAENRVRTLFGSLEQSATARSVKPSL